MKDTITLFLEGVIVICGILIIGIGLLMNIEVLGKFNPWSDIWCIALGVALVGIACAIHTHPEEEEKWWHQ